MIIGSHVSMSAPEYLVGAVKHTIAYSANAFMIYTGPPQNTIRKSIDAFRVEEAQALMKEAGIAASSMIVHAPYIINLANTTKPETFELAVEFLIKEIERVKAIGGEILVLHPGSHIKAGEEIGLDKIVQGLDIAMQNIGDVKIAIETMSGKGSEIGYCFEHIRYLIDHCLYGKQLYVCMDTCHLHDAGYDLENFDAILDEFDRVVGLERLVCLHVNDSKNVQGAKKDRHANIGYGEISFTKLHAIVHNPRIVHVVKILETPYIEGYAPYAHEIAMLKSGVFDEQLMMHVKEENR